MPKKSRRVKIFQSKRKQMRQRPLESVSQQPEVTEIRKPVTSAPPARTSSPRASNIARYPYVIVELKRIGILAGIMLIILIVLALALP
jgi:hypothetical protein